MIGAQPQKAGDDFRAETARRGQACAPCCGCEFGRGTAQTEPSDKGRVELGNRHGGCRLRGGGRQLGRETGDERRQCSAGERVVRMKRLDGVRHQPV